MQGLLQMKHHPEQIKKNKAFLMLANYWDQYSEKKKDLEKYGQYLEESYEEPKLSEDLMEEARSVVEEAIDSCLERHITDWGKMKNVIKDSLGEFLWKRTKRSPMILPIIMEA